MTSPKQRLPAFPGLAKKLSRLIQFATVSSYTVTDEVEEGFVGAHRRVASAFFPSSIGPSNGKAPPTGRFSIPGKEAIRALLRRYSAPHLRRGSRGEFPGLEQGAFPGLSSTDSSGAGAVQDIKVLMASIMEAAEQLLDQGFKPRETILFAFGGTKRLGAHAGRGR
jgi:hypothetical protein